MCAVSRRHALVSIAAAALGIGGLAAVAHADGGPYDGYGRPQPRPPARPPGEGRGLKAHFTPEDRAINQRCIDKTMREAPTGATWKWSNPKSGNGGSVKPLSRAQRHGDQVCRRFEETITLADGRTETVRGQACRRPDGSWAVA